MNNLFVSYDLKNPGQNYERVITAVKGLGPWAKVQYSLWYVKSSHTAKDAAEIVRRAQDTNDNLIVVDATNSDAAWFGHRSQGERVPAAAVEPARHGVTVLTRALPSSGKTTKETNEHEQTAATTA